MKYRDIFIYVMNIGTFFQYQFSINGEIYHDYIVVKPKFLWNLKWKLGRVDSPFSIEEFDRLEEVLLSGAVTVIDTLISGGILTKRELKKKENQIKAIEDDIIDRSGKSCMWRAIETKQGFYYECLTHGMMVKMADGQKPVHDILSPVQAEDINVNSNG